MILYYVVHTEEVLPMILSGNSLISIIIPKAATEREQFAANELEKYLSVPSLVRLRNVGYFCGMDYASKNVYDFSELLDIM